MAETFDYLSLRIRTRDARLWQLEQHALLVPAFQRDLSTGLLEGDMGSFKYTPALSTADAPPVEENIPGRLAYLAKGRLVYAAAMVGTCTWNRMTGGSAHIEAGPDGEPDVVLRATDPNRFAGKIACMHIASSAGFVPYEPARRPNRHGFTPNISPVWVSQEPIVPIETISVAFDEIPAIIVKCGPKDFYTGGPVTPA